MTEPIEPYVVPEERLNPDGTLTISVDEVQFLERLITDLWNEAAHLDRYPGAIFAKRERFREADAEGKTALYAEGREVRKRFEVQHATHTTLNLRRWSNKLRGILEGVNRPPRALRVATAPRYLNREDDR